ncbi:uncharacterized protein LOC144915173 [Branchiostoma floridae x Branchiostoma belcheri]
MMTMSQPCPVGVCITILREDTDGAIIIFERKCHSGACTDDNKDGVLSRDAAGGETEYEKCCDDSADCNVISYNQLRGAADRAVTNMAAILFSAMILLLAL